MAVEVVMPQMGESIFEGTVTKWLKKTGDRVERDEPLFEISTDKVDAESLRPQREYCARLRCRRADGADSNRSCRDRIGRGRRRRQGSSAGSARGGFLVRWSAAPISIRLPNQLLAERFRRLFLRLRAPQQ